MMAIATQQLLHSTLRFGPNLRVLSPHAISRSVRFSSGSYCANHLFRLRNCAGRRNLARAAKPSSENGGVPAPEGDDGVSLGTMKLPLDTDIPRFETLLFQPISAHEEAHNSHEQESHEYILNENRTPYLWAMTAWWGNSLCQGAQLPLPLPLKVDKIAGGVRLGFVSINDGKTEVPVYIDCLVYAASTSNDSSTGPMFRAIRNGPKKDQPPPGEPRIMKSLLAALQKSVEISRV